MLFVPKFKSYENAKSALDIATYCYEEANREYREYYNTFTDSEDPHLKFLRKQTRRYYKNLQRTLEGLRRSGYSQMATTYLLSV